MNLNYTSSNLLYSGFTLSGDFAVGYLKDIEKLLESDVQVALVFGDADYICNWPGGEALSLAVGWSGAEDFHDAGYTNLVVGGEAYGETRQYGKLSFTRVWNSGHEVPCKKSCHPQLLRKNCVLSNDAGKTSNRRPLSRFSTVLPIGLILQLVKSRSPQTVSTKRMGLLKLRVQPRFPRCQPRPKIEFDELFRC